MTSRKHRATPAKLVGVRWMCDCGRERVLRVVRSRYGSQSPIRNRFGQATWRAGHGPVLDPERWAAWQAARKVEA